MIRALILAHDFPPLNSIGGHRPLSWYKYFNEFGIYPIVVTKDWGEKSGTIKDILAHKNHHETKIEESAQGKLVRVPIDLSFSERMLLRVGERRWRKLRKAFTFLSLILSYPFSQFDKNKNILKEAERILSNEKVDIIIATGEPFILFKHAYLLHRKFKIPWVADYRDGWFLNHINLKDRRATMKFLRWWEVRFERKYISTSAFITSVDPLLTEKLSIMHSKEAYIIYNGFESFYNGNHTSANKLPLILSHAGTIYPQQRVEVLLQAVKELNADQQIKASDLQIYFLGIDFYRDQRKRVMNFSRKTRSYIKTTERIPQSKVMEFNAQADFLLIFTEENYPVIPAKTYEYLSMKKPILSILNNRSILAALLKDLNAGVNIDSKDDLKKFLLSKIEEKKKGHLVTHQEINEDRARFYLRRNQTKIFANLIKQKLSHA